MPAIPFSCVLLPLLTFAGQAHFETRRLSADFTCEGANFADFDGDGDMDVIAGPYWYEGPEFTRKHAIYEQEPFDPKGYSNHFFAWPRDFDGDGWMDVLVVGFPGKEAFWYENPGPKDVLWARHLVHPKVDNESPAYADLTGDGTPELVFHSKGTIGWAEPDASDPRAAWIFHPISEITGRRRFTHGLGVGDVDGDGRADVLLKDEWRRQPLNLEGNPVWEAHPVAFAPEQGGAQMLVCDVDGDGDSDVITSLEAHGFGLVWHEQTSAGGDLTFEAHTILGAQPEDSPHGLRFGEIHALTLADMNGDGLSDLVTGKRWWSHGAKGDPEPGAPAVVYWFELERRADGSVDFVPHLVHDDSGVGCQVVAGDVDGDGRLDVVTGNKKGAFVHLQRPGPRAEGEFEEVTAEEQSEATPPDSDPGPEGDGFLPESSDGQRLNFDFESGDLSDWVLEGEAFEGQPIEGDSVHARRSDDRSGHQGRFWIGTYERDGDGPRGTLTSHPFVVSKPWISFWLGGGRRESTCAELVLAESEEVVSRFSGGDREELRPVIADLSAHVGSEIFVRLVDDSDGDWGHINFDHLRLHAERPSFGELEPLLPFDEVEHAGLTPAEAVAAMTVPEGFRVELVAAEPDVHQPVAFTIDERGRLWVAEAYSYPEKRPEGEGRDRILILADEDGDGSFESRRVFLEGLNLVSGLEVGFGGVWIGQAPELLFVPDRDRDDLPDGAPQVLLDGWGLEDTHETLNAFTWGPDGWLYGCHGVFTHSRVGAPGTADDQRVPIDAGIWRFHPTRHDFEVFAWGTSNPWGIDFDDHGQAFATACVIPHLFHIVQGGRYQRQAGEHFDAHVYREIGTIADHRHYVGEWSHVGNLRSNAAGGGHAHCGAMIYLGDSFPEEYRGRMFFNNVHGNRVNTDILERRGSSFIGRHGPDFLLANDRWFRGVNLRMGPDGSVFLIDWYDEQACHTSLVGAWDRGNGRIYRISYGDAPYAAVDLSQASPKELAQLQLDANEWKVRTARRLLQERGGDLATRKNLLQIVERHPAPDRRLRALWALHASDNLDQSTLLGLLGDPEEHLRAWAVQLLCESKHPSRTARDAFASMAIRDPSPLVRSFLASALQRLPLANRWPLAESLAARSEDADDPNLPALLWYGVEPLVTVDPERALQLARRTKLKDLAHFIWRRAAVEVEAHDGLLRALSDLADDGEQRRVLDAMVQTLSDRPGMESPASWATVRDELLASEDPQLRERANLVGAFFGDASCFAALRTQLLDTQAPYDRRRLAHLGLGRGKDPELGATLLELLDDSELRGEALRGLAACNQPEISSSILARWADFDESARMDAVTTLVARRTWAGDLLDALEDGRVPRSALTAQALRTLAQHADVQLQQRLEKVWGVFRPTAEEQRAAIARWMERLTPDKLAGADLAHGRDVYARTCQRCHVLWDEGGTIGPEITGANRKDLAYLLENVLDPSAQIPLEYRATLVRTVDGRLLTGIRSGEAQGVVRLATENEVVVLDPDEIEELRLETASMMPEGQLETLTESEVCDLFAYLMGDRQVPLPLGPDELSSFFDGKTLSGWEGDPKLWSVEQGQIVGRTQQGLNQNAFLSSAGSLANFRLTLEVKLNPNSANSGIQFRSRRMSDGEVAGYQADIGAGWWGKLYEEHGRGLLWDRPGDEHVQPEEWNRYEILAVGDRVQTWINGQLCVDHVDPEGAREGIIAFQMHSGGPLEVRFRKLQLEWIDPESQSH